jgi:MOSC domain-containing protein YiiM
MQLISVNIGKAQPIQNAKSSGITGIFKQPVMERVPIASEGLFGDTICDTENHGGVDQAVYIYGVDDYDWWAQELRREMPPGTFGENLTISGLVSADYLIGDRFHTGSVILEVTAPRIPCVTIAARMSDPQFVKRFRYAERPGLYCRVIQEGEVQAGDEVRVEKYAGETISALEMFQEFYEPKRDEITTRRFLAAPIAIRDRVEKEGLLEKLLGRK